ncbi:response regulator [Streptomyces sp. SID13031]|uniref:response regulator n=1 Tax=Streptomyces sp. SID13031 TaxID=2706046 RepID=UPI0013C7C408|nr:response regulator [Streptomyces sp. SID13031]NEA31747.1 response regulator [Streptomyces sp. SID13031]
MAAADVVLVVDDDADIREAIRRIVAKCGYSALTASDSRAALRAADAVDGPIRLLLTDVWMPGDISASTLAGRLAGRYPDLRVVYVSGLSKELAVDKGLVGANASFLEKPFTPARLVETIRAALGDSGTGIR